LIVQLIEKKIRHNTRAHGFLFDGFPRTVVQAYILEGLLLKFNSQLSCMLGLEVPQDELMKRLLSRAKDSNRSDDNEEVIKRRLKEYREKTLPVVDFYKEKEKYFPIDGVGAVESIFQRLDKAVNSTLKDSWQNIVVFGRPGAGKGVQAKRLAEKYNLVFIATGDMMREEISKGTDTGRAAKAIMEAGGLVPDEIPIRLIEGKIKTSPNARGFIFKGFPRTIVQAYILDGLLRRLNSSVTCMIHFKMPMLQCIKRLKKRGEGPQRRPYDKDTDVIIHRMEEYEEITAHAEEYYKEQGKYYDIDADRPQDVVFTGLQGILETASRVI
ncbi:MAG: AAA family ATPase, partial [bacterium]|nr:AAA family ATPase [bacterium]